MVLFDLRPIRANWLSALPTEVAPGPARYAERIIVNWQAGQYP